uniref:Cytochrome b6-f complex subunit 7 n=1 Tax=Periphykon beckeri TaxID=2006982 RepID=A0A1Z1M3R2_9FLOR|nr:cytochrome b6-f complex subunit 7 [Periphykon beckeri]ARW60425.1 cytochrome b6-f complex subunit 7 [Periphykon beckeri]
MTSEIVVAAIISPLTIMFGLILGFLLLKIQGE